MTGDFNPDSTDWPTEEYDPIASDEDEAWEEIIHQEYTAPNVPGVLAKDDLRNPPTTFFMSDLALQVQSAIKFSSKEDACACVIKTDAHGRDVVEICDWHDGFRAAVLAYTEGLIR